MESIKASELRIGNYVYGVSDRIEVIKEISDNGMYRAILPKLHMDNWYSNFISDISPIPLTPELLLKCGFEKDGDEVEQIYWYQTTWPIVGEICTCDVERGNYVYDCDTDTLRIEYLHQLQNLYHSLVGHELTINL